MNVPVQGVRTSVIVVCADSGGGLSACVGAALGSVGTLELILIDNASSDGSVDAVAARWNDDSRFRLIRNAGNLGFGRACNIAAAAASGDELLILNPDCFLKTDTLEQLLAIKSADPAIGLLGAQIIDADDVPEPASRRRDPLVREALMDFSGLARMQSRWPVLRGSSVPPATVDVQNVDAVSGALMLISRELFMALGGFDEGYFLHCEDLDLCRRVRDRGFVVACANLVRVVHAKGSSSHRRPLFVARHKHRGMWRWFVKFDPAAGSWLPRNLVRVGIWAHFVVSIPRYLWTLLRTAPSAND